MYAVIKTTVLIVSIVLSSHRQVSPSKPPMSGVFLPPSQTRLVTIIAHVDHGKTTLADNLIEHNGLISERLAGTLRYLDADPEEQRRGITMRSSAIGLQYGFVEKGKEEPVKHIVHLLDSPGHTDFSMEVSSSLLACDTCLIVLDAIEGMAPRTHQVLREAYVHRLVPILVINKMDRLCTDLGLDATESYVRLRTLLETVNAAASGMLTSAAQVEVEVMNTAGSRRRRRREKVQQKEKEDDSFYEAYWTFEPCAGNVIFASALFGWGFTVPSLARSLFRNKVLPIKPVMLKQALFSDTKYRHGKALKWKATDPADHVPFFAEYALQPLWTIYECLAVAVAAVGGTDSRIRADSPGMEQVVEALQTASTATRPMIVTNQTELQQLLDQTGASSQEAVLRSVLRRYRPLAEAVLDAICDYAPAPDTAASRVRARVLTLQEPPTEAKAGKGLGQMQQAIRTCDVSTGAPTVAHVCKFIGTNLQYLQNDPTLPRPLPGEKYPTVLLGLTRVLSGCLRTDTSYKLFGPKYKGDAEDDAPERSIRLFLLMGSSFISVKEVPAGHLCAVYNLEGIPFKTVTLCDKPNGMPISGFGRTTLRPLVKVQVEPDAAEDMNVLERGLVKLTLADAAVEVTATARGERILACLGEIHLEQCVLDLERIFCEKEIKVRVSDPIVDFGETTDWFENETDDFLSFFNSNSPPMRQITIPPYSEEEGASRAHNGRTRATLPGKTAAISLRVVPLHPSIHMALQNGELVEEGDTEEILKIGKALGISSVEADVIMEQLLSMHVADDHNGNAIMVTLGLQNGCCIKGVPSSTGEVFVDKLTETEEDSGGEDESSDAAEEAKYNELRYCIASHSNSTENGDQSGIDQAALKIWNQELQGSIAAGFRMAMRSGWICEEPVHNVLVVLEGVEIALAENDGSFSPPKPLTGGMIVSSLRSGIRSALLSRPARLLEGLLKLTLHTTLSGVGTLYTVLNKRRGKVLEDTMVDGTELLLISALIPQAESFGLTPELLQKSSGEVTAPELIFSHWELLDVDPFWIPTSEEEREDYGELQQAGDSSTGLDNTAIRYIRMVRQRKGLLVDSSRMVVAAEKQRTLKK